MQTARPTSRFAFSFLVVAGVTLAVVSAPVTAAFAQTIAPETLTAPAAAPLAAANEISLTAIPPRLGDIGEIKVKPGQKFQATARVTNTGSQPIEIESFA